MAAEVDIPKEIWGPAGPCRGNGGGQISLLHKNKNTIEE